MKLGIRRLCTKSLICVVWGWIVVAACSSEIQVEFQLTEPCDQPGLLVDNCSFLRLLVSSLDPQDDLYCSQDANKPGPLPVDCSFGARSCDLSGSELLGNHRKVDAFCYTTPGEQIEPLVRATSTVFDLQDGSEGTEGKKFGLLSAPINGFVSTTSLTDDNGTAGSCSEAEGGGRYGHAAVLLDDGRVLLSGGISRSVVQETYLEESDLSGVLEWYDPKTGRFDLVKDAQQNQVTIQRRAFHTASRLRDGRILLAGGVGFVNNQPTSLQIAELFDPKNLSFVRISMSSSRAHHSATVLGTGSVLIAGGMHYGTGVIDDSAILFEPQTQSFKKVEGKMTAPRIFHQAVVLDFETAGGRVLLTGGQNLGGTLSSSELYNPNTNRFESQSLHALKQARARHCAVLLDNQDVLLIGGGSQDAILEPSIELYRYPDGFSDINFSLVRPRMDHSCNLLEDGSILVAGGRNETGQAIGSSELILSVHGSYSALELTTHPMQPARFWHTATILENGWVFMAGGLPEATDGSSAISKNQLFAPAPRCK